jgi:hypothetical protein
MSTMTKISAGLSLAASRSWICMALYVMALICACQ